MPIRLPMLPMLAPAFALLAESAIDVEADADPGATGDLLTLPEPVVEPSNLRGGVDQVGPEGIRKGIQN